MYTVYVISYMYMYFIALNILIWRKTKVFSGYSSSAEEVLHIDITSATYTFSAAK